MKNQMIIKKIGPHIGFILVYILWGINTTSMKIGGHDWNPLVFNGLRYLIISPILWVIAWVCWRRYKLSYAMQRRDVLLIIGLGILSAVGMEAMLSYALQYSNSANGAVLGRGFMPVVTAILTIAMGRLRLTWRMMAGIPLAFIGVILVVSAGTHHLHFGYDTMHGDLLLLLRSLFGAIYLIGMNRLVRRYPLPLLISIEMTAGAVSLLPFVCWKVNGAYLAHIPHEGWVSLFYTAGFATIIGFYLHNWSLGKLGAYKSSVYGYLLPITAATAGYIVLHEQLSLQQAAGGAVVLAAMFIVQRDKRAQELDQMSPGASTSPLENGLNRES